MELWIGKSKVLAVDLGEEGKFSAISGLQYSHFQGGELVLALRSSGKWTIAQIGTLCPEFGILVLGGGLEKQVASTETPLCIRKLIGSFCLKSQLVVFRNGTHPAFVPAPIGISNLFPICLGQDCSTLNQCGGFSSNCFHCEELVSYLTSSRRVCAVVKEIARDHSEIIITDGVGFIKLSNQEVINKIFKLYDRYLVEPNGTNSWFPTVTVGRNIFQGLVLGQDTSNFVRTSDYRVEHFFIGEPVSVKQADGSRIAHQIQCVNSDGSILVSSSETHLVSVSHVSKLEGSFYIIDGNADSILIKLLPNGIQIAQTTACPLLMGSHASSMHRIQGCGVFYVGEAVSVLLDDGNHVIGQVTHTCPFKVAMCGGRELNVAHDFVTSTIGRLLGCFFLIDQPALSPQSGVVSSSPVADRQHVRYFHPLHFRGFGFYC